MIQALALSAYLAEVSAGLKGLCAGRRRLILRELESHLLDEVEALGVADEAGMRRLLADKEAPSLLAARLSEEEARESSHHTRTAFVAGCLLTLFAGGCLCVQYPASVVWDFLFAAGFGLAVGTCLFLVRPRWQSLHPLLRLALSVLFGSMLAFPLCMRPGWHFIPNQMMYGAFAGYLVERHAQVRPSWTPVVETLGFSLLDFGQLCLFWPCAAPYYDWPRELALNFVLALGIVMVQGLRRHMAVRWLLAPGGR